MQIAVIGCGVMGSALARHFSKSHSVILCDRNSSKSEAVQKADVIVLAVKPKDLKTLVKEIGSLFQPHQIVISILAGTPVALLRDYFPKPILVRAMPNLPLICGEGVVGLAKTAELSLETKEQVSALCQGLGLLLWLSEDKLEGLSALAGSGPAFVFVLIEAMIDSGIFLGFTQAESQELVLKTIEGAVKLLRETGSCPTELKWKVASPGGTTISGLKALEEGGIRALLMNTFQATFLKAREL